jgi:hypothetical protein
MAGDEFKGGMSRVEGIYLMRDEWLWREIDSYDGWHKYNPGQIYSLV